MVKTIPTLHQPIMLWITEQWHGGGGWNVQGRSTKKQGKLPPTSTHKIWCLKIKLNAKEVKMQPNWLINFTNWLNFDTQLSDWNLQSRRVSAVRQPQPVDRLRLFVGSSSKPVDSLFVSRNNLSTAYCPAVALHLRSMNFNTVIGSGCGIAWGVRH